MVTTAPVREQGVMVLVIFHTRIAQAIQSQSSGALKIVGRHRIFGFSLSCMKTGDINHIVNLHSKSVQLLNPIEDTSNDEKCTKSPI
jgi:hypothetical protein